MNTQDGELVTVWHGSKWRDDVVALPLPPPRRVHAHRSEAERREAARDAFATLFPDVPRPDLGKARVGPIILNRLAADGGWLTVGQLAQRSGCTRTPVQLVVNALLAQSVVERRRQGNGGAGLGVAPWAYRIRRTAE